MEELLCVGETESLKFASTAVHLRLQFESELGIGLGRGDGSRTRIDWSFPMLQCRRSTRAERIRCWVLKGKDAVASDTWGNLMPSPSLLGYQDASSRHRQGWLGGWADAGRMPLVGHFGRWKGTL